LFLVFIYFTVVLNIGKEQSAAAEKANHNCLSKSETRLFVVLNIGKKQSASNGTGSGVSEEGISVPQSAAAEAIFGKTIARRLIQPVADSGTEKTYQIFRMKICSWRIGRERVPDESVSSYCFWVHFPTTKVVGSNKQLSVIIIGSTNPRIYPWVTDRA